MFDGNFRSRPRPVNLSRGTASRRDRQQRPQGKAQILQASKELRAARLQAAQREAASVKLQAVVRGRLVRRRLAEMWHAQLSMYLASNDKTPSWETTTTVLFNRWLALPASLIAKQKDALLRRYAVLLTTTTTTTASTASLPQAPRVVQACLEQLVVQEEEDAMQVDPNDDNAMQVDHDDNSDQTVWMKALQILLFGGGHSAESQQDLWKRVGGLTGLLHMARALNASTVTIQETLWQWIQLIPPDTREGRAVLGALLWTRPHVPPREAQPALVALAGTLCHQSEHAMQEDETQQEREAVTRLLEGQETRLVHNLLQAQAAAAFSRETNNNLEWVQACVLLISHLVSSSQVLAAGRVVAVGSSSQAETTATSASRHNDSDSDSDSDDDDDDDRVHAPAGAKRPRPVGRYSKQEVQTVRKLDRLAATRIQTAAQLQTVQHDDDDLAAALGQPEPWIAWGKTLFQDNDHHDSVIQDQACAAYCALLAALLQSCTGLSPRSSVASPFVTAAAFDPTLLEGLWKYCVRRMATNPQETATLTALLVFCDLFAHGLVALKDDQFLAQHGAAATSTIHAQAVLEHCKTALYDLYWTRPVLASHLLPLDHHLNGNREDPNQTAAVRARLLLSGTKVFNSLYERWCRLVRTNPFCDESVWWFPTLLTDSTVRLFHGNSNSNSDNEDDQEDALAQVFSDPKMARLLASIPQVVPFDRRVKLFSQLLSQDKARTQEDGMDAVRLMMNGQDPASRNLVEIRRDHLYTDAKQTLVGMGPKLKSKVKVVFINQHGTTESGIDGGGVFKEFLDDLIKDAFLAHDYFSVTPLQTLAVHSDPSSLDKSDASNSNTWLEHYEFLGRVLGKAVYEGILVEPQFCLPFLGQLLGKTNTLEDLKNWDPEMYKHLIALLDMPDAALRSLGLTMEVTMGKARSVELVPDGRLQPVTRANVMRYVHLVAHVRLNVQAAAPVKAFLQGFRAIVPASWVRLFAAHELQKLISGDDAVGVNVAALEAAMQYAGGYHPSQEIIQWFWQIVKEDLTGDQQRALLRFMTSCSRPPLLGFASLEPAPCVQQIRLPADLQDQAFAPLPSSATCMNLLKLPAYTSKQVLRSKLVTAIEAKAGFELT